jgi:betaine-aldehyde dehydrogenase
MAPGIAPACPVNTWGTLNEQFEQVGVKASGYGPLLGPRAIEEFQDLKVYVEVDASVAVA